MYLEYFGLNDYPFIQSAKNELYFKTADNTIQCETIHHWLDGGHSMLLVSGPAGVGRTALVHHALDSSPVAHIDRYVIGALGLEPDELLHYIATEMGLDCAATDAISLRHVIRAFLQSQASINRRVCLVVQNAGQLSEESLAFLQDLTRDHTLYLPLCLVVLLVDEDCAVGIENLQRNAAAQRVYRLLKVEPLNLSETRAFLDQRLCQQSGMYQRSARQLFSPSITQAIHGQTAGIAFSINVLCDFALLECYRSGAQKINYQHLRRAVISLGWEIRFEIPSASARRSAVSDQAAVGGRKRLGALEQSVHELVSGVTTIGRAPDCAIRIEGDNVSPYQALIVRTDEGMFIRNEGGSLPLYLNSHRVDSANLSAGDKLQIGSYEFQVDLDGTGGLSLVSSSLVKN